MVLGRFAVADDDKQPLKPLSDAAASHSIDRVASRDTSQSKKGHRHQSGIDPSGYSSAPTNSAVSHRRCRLTDITLELLLTAAATTRTLW